LVLRSLPACILTSVSSALNKGDPMKSLGILRKQFRMNRGDVLSELKWPTRADFVLDQSAHLFTFSLSANHNAGNEKFTPRRARKYCRFLGLP
jgi:hypothetical protein